LWVALCLSVACAQSPVLKVPPPVTIYVAAASDLTPAFTEIGTALGSSKPIKAVFTFGSSGLLSKQIEQGAPPWVGRALLLPYLFTPLLHFGAHSELIRGIPEAVTRCWPPIAVE